MHFLPPFLVSSQHLSLYFVPMSFDLTPLPLIKRQNVCVGVRGTIELAEERSLCVGRGCINTRAK